MHDVLILGSGRSGTSMVAGSLARAGYFMGDRLYPARDANPLGFFEDPEVNGINEELLAPHVPAEQGLRAPQRWLARLDRSVEAPLPLPLAQRVRALTARAPFCLKDPRFSYTLPAWRAELGHARFVCVFRDPATTVASLVKECATADYLRGVRFDERDAIELWCATYGQIVKRHRRQGEWLFLHYDQMLAGGGAERLTRFLGAPVDAQFATPKLKRSRPAVAPTAEARKLYAELCELAEFDAVDRAPSRPRDVSIPSLGSPVAAQPDVSVLVCTYRRKPVLLECLAAFANQTLDPSRYEIVVVDDGSGDGSAAAARAFPSRAPIRVVERTRNGGLSSARSAAVAAARGELVLFVNDDTIAFPDLLERHVAAHARRRGEPVAVLGTFEQPREQLATALMRALERSHLVFAYAGLRADVEHDWTRFWGCNVSVDRRAVLEAGAFDATFRHYGCEETDLALRLFGGRLRVHFEPAARAWHRHVLTFADLERRQRLVARAYVRLFAKHPGALDHPDWRSLATATRDGLEKDAARRVAETRPLVELASRLAAVDLGALESRGEVQPRIVDASIEQLERWLVALSHGWWSGGLAEGLRELGAESFAELRAWRGAASSASPWPLAVDRPFRLLAWPRWDDESELAHALATAADPRLPVAPLLCLRHDATIDGPLEVARARLQRVSESALPAGRDVDALIVAEPIAPHELPRLGRAVSGALLFDSSESGERARFFTRVGAPGVRGVEDLLAFAPAVARGDDGPPITDAARTIDATTRGWCELSV
jgi:GT2 family glycosyltransferase